MAADRPPFERPQPGPAEGFPAVRGASDRMQSPSGAPDTVPDAAPGTVPPVPEAPGRSAAWLRFLPADQTPLAIIMGVALALAATGPFSPGSVLSTGIGIVDIILRGVICAGVAYVAWLVAGRQRPVIGFLGLALLADLAVATASLIVEPILVTVLALIAGIFSWAQLGTFVLDRATIVGNGIALAVGLLVAAFIIKDPSGSRVSPSPGSESSGLPPLPPVGGGLRDAGGTSGAQGLFTRLRDVLGFGPDTDAGARRLAFWSAALVAAWSLWFGVSAIIDDLTGGLIPGAAFGQAAGSALGLIRQYGAYVVLFAAIFWAIRHWGAPTGMWIPFAVYFLTGELLAIATSLPNVGLGAAASAVITRLTSLSSGSPAWIPVVLVEIAAVYVATSGRVAEQH